MAEIAQKRPTIAFLVSELEEDYCEGLCNGIIDAAEQNDVNLIVLPGRPINYIYGNEYNNNIIYEYVNRNNVDALVISALVLSGFISKEEFAAFFLRFRPLPMVSIGVPIEGIPGVFTNNRTGFKQVLNHLIYEHGKHRIAFIKGLDGHIDADERFCVYREVLAENGLEYDPDLVVPGDFTVESADIAMKILDERNVGYDAIAVANDIMAFGVLKILRKRNILVPDQIAVTGFDNGEGAKHFNPSLTTVKQPIYEQSKKALEMALELIQGKQPDNVVLDTEIIIRESCGCLSETLQAFDVHSLDLELKQAVHENLDLDIIIFRFIDKNLGRVDNRAGNVSFLKLFIHDCFVVLTRDELVPRETDMIFRSFKSLVDVPDLEEDDLLTIQKTISALKRWIDTITKNKNNWIVEDFFQRLRVLVTDIAFKMQGTQLNFHHSEVCQLRRLLVEMISKVHNYREQLQSIIPRLRSMNINNCFVYLYDKPIRHCRDNPWQNPLTVNLAFGYNDENWILGENHRQFPWEKVIDHEFLPRNKRYTLMLKPLFVEDEHMGLILMEFNMQHNYMFESIIIQMSCALRLSLLFFEREQIDNRLHEAVKKLEEYNRKLKNISQTDELTGLYNRRGFLNLAKQSLNLARKQGKSGLIFYADMDGLKKINDQYGHDEGDIAIRAMGRILVKTFQTSDIISRYGGDEFTIFTLDAGLELLPVIQERLLQFIGEYNLESRKPYQISITIGAVSYNSTNNMTLESLIRQADNLLYEQKRQKKDSHSL